MAGLLLLPAAFSCHATTFTWTNIVSGNASGNWTNQANWGGGTLPTTSGDTADFSTLDVTVDSTVTITNSSQTINKMIFGDVDTTTPAAWTLAGLNNANTLTLAGTNPTIIVNALGTGKSATNHIVLAGSAFIKDGPGALVLNGSGPNTFTGTTIVTNGSLVLSKSDNILCIPGDLVVAAGTTVTSTAKAQLSSNANLYVNGTFDTGSKALTVNSLVLDNNASILGASSSVFITNNTLYDVRSGTVNPNLAGAAGMTKSTAGLVVLTNGAGANVFTGPVLVNGGILQLGHAGVGQGLPGTTITITNGGTLQLGKDTQINSNGTVVVNGGTYDLAGHNDAFSTLILDNGGVILNGGNAAKTLTISTNIDFRNGLCASKLAGAAALNKSTAGTVTLAFDNAYTGGTMISGGVLALGDGSSTNRGMAGTGPITNNAALVLNHSGAFTLSNSVSGAGSLTNLGGQATLIAASTYSGGTTILGGTVYVNNTSGSGTGSGAVTVSGGTLAGTGIIAGPVTIQSSANIAPGIPGVGTLSISNTLTLHGNASMDINSAGMGDMVVASSINYGGTLTVNNVGPALAAGNTFPLFSAGSQSGNFTGISGNPGANLAFYFNPATGVLSVVSTAPTQPTLSFSQSGGNLTFSWTDSTFHLQSQTNALNVGVGTNWYDYPGGATSPVTITPDPTQPMVLFRLVN